MAEVTWNWANKWAYIVFFFFFAKQHIFQLIFTSKNLRNTQQASINPFDPLK